MKKIVITVLVALATIVNITAQIEKLIPEDAGFVFGLNTKNLSNELNKEKVKNLPIFKELKADYDKKIARGRATNEYSLFSLLFEQEKTGLNYEENFYFFVTNRGSYTIASFLLPIKDKEVFFASFKKVFGGDISELKQGGTFNQMSGLYDDSYFILSFGGKLSQSTNYDLSWKERKELRAKREEKTKEVTAKFHQSVFSNGSNSLMKNKSFKKALRQKRDVFAWASSDYLVSESMMKFMQNAVGGIREVDVFKVLNQDWVKDAFVGLDFNEKDITLDMKIKFGEDLKPFTKKIYKTRLNPKFKKYIDKDKTMFVSSSAIKPTEFIPLFKKLYLDVSSATKEIAPINKDIYELYDLVINQENIMKLWSGDVSFSFQGMNKQVVEHITYDYNEEYEYVERRVIDTVDVPEFVYLLATDDKEHIQNILNIIEYTKLIIKEGDYYSFTENNLNFYITLVDDVLLFTNNKEMVTTYRNGLPAKHHYKLPRRGNSYNEIDFQKILPVFLKILTNKWNYEERAFTRALMDYTKAGKSSVKIKKGKASVKIDLTNIEDNAFTTFMHYLDKNYVYYLEEREFFRP